MTRIEEYGLFLEFDHNGRRHTALLEKDEAKVRRGNELEDLGAGLGGSVVMMRLEASGG